MTASRNRAVAERFAQCHATGDIAGCTALLAPAATGRSTLAAGPAEGRDAVAAQIAAGLARWSDRHETVVAVIADASSGGIETAVTGTTATGASATVGTVTALGIEDGLIASIRVYCDTTPFTA